MTITTSCNCQGKHLFCLIVLFCCLSIAGRAQPDLSLMPVITTGLSSPIQFVHAGDGSNRAFIVQQGGTIRAYSYDGSFHYLSDFLTVSNVNFGGEMGLLSMAFHPDYANNGLLYVYYVNSGGNLELARYHTSADPNIADASSKIILITIPHPTNNNHNGGELHFGNDGYLYLSTGDGGGSGDQPNNAQNTTVLLGKMLRFNVNTSSTAPYYTIPAGNPFGNEIFDLGLRNPFRWSFDRLTNDMWIGDVGQDTFEEINFRAAGSTAGVNYGWHCYEANSTFNTTGCGPISNYVFPVYTYPTQNPSAAVTGGIVYRGTAYPALQGYNISADFFSGVFYKTVSDGVGGWTTTTQTLSPIGIVDFGETENGEAYVISLTGNSVYQVVASAGALPVKLLAFSGMIINESVQLNWQTASEQNTKQFEIEYSTNGIAFVSTGTVAAKNVPGGSTYTFLHAINYNGTLFYRLKIVDLDGSYTYSDIIRATLSDKAANIIYPSIITNGYINLHLGNTSYHSVELISMNGVQVFKRNISGQSGNIKIATGKLAAGIYMARLYTLSGSRSQKIIIQ